MISPKYVQIEKIFYLLAAIEDGLEDDIKDESISKEKGDGYLSLVRSAQQRMSDLYETDIHNAAYYRELYLRRRMKREATDGQNI